MASELPVAHPSDGEGVHTAFKALYNWNYEPEIDQVRILYANALNAQWIALRDLDWDGELDREVFSSSFPLGGLQLQETNFWKNLPEEIRHGAACNMGAFLLSNFLHGEQGALMVAGQLVNAVPHMDAKFYAATQTLDEARHVEVFSAYIRKLGRIYPLAPAVKNLLDTTLASDNWRFKAVGMQVVTEGLALFMFREMRNATREPLLKKLLTYVSRDEARHTGYGIKYLSYVVPQLSPEERRELEDFAFEAARILIDSRSGTTLRQSALQVLSETGLDLAAVLPEILKERDKLREAAAREQRRPGAVRGFIIPTLRTIGLFSDRIESHFDEIFARMPGTSLGPIRNDVRELPEDLEAWVLDGA